MVLLSLLVGLVDSQPSVNVGPYKVNGVPLRRVNQAFVIATSTKVDLSDVTLPDIDDSYFAKEKPASGKKESKEEQFFAQAASVRCCLSISSCFPPRVVVALLWCGLCVYWHTATRL